MDGVNILNQYTKSITTASDIVWIVVASFAIVIAVVAMSCSIGLWIAVSYHKNDLDEKKSLSKAATVSAIIFIAVIILFIVSLFCETCNDDIANVTYYEVSVDDTVSFNEFTDKYEIVKCNGKIFTVKDKK